MRVISYCSVRAIVIIVDGAGLQEGRKQRSLEEIQPFPWITFFNITMDYYKKSQSIWRAFIQVILVYYFQVDPINGRYNQIAERSKMQEEGDSFLQKQPPKKLNIKPLRLRQHRLATMQNESHHLLQIQGEKVSLRPRFLSLTQPKRSNLTSKSQLIVQKLLEIGFQQSQIKEILQGADTFKKAANLILRKREEAKQKQENVNDESQHNNSKDHPQMLLLVRTDLRMSFYKSATQITLATLKNYRKSRKEEQATSNFLSKWGSSGSNKVIVKRVNQEKLWTLLNKAEQAGINNCWMTDTGIITVGAIGPASSSELDPIIMGAISPASSSELDLIAKHHKLF